MIARICLLVEMEFVIFCGKLNVLFVVVIDTGYQGEEG